MPRMLPVISQPGCSSSNQSKETIAPKANNCKSAQKRLETLNPNPKLCTALHPKPKTPTKPHTLNLVRAATKVHVHCCPTS